MSIGLKLGAAAAAVVAVGLALTFQSPSTEIVQVGYRGTGMEQIYHRSEIPRLIAANQVPEAQDKASSAGPKASTEYTNVKVLGDLSVDEFNRLMLVMTEWVSPEQGCNYCHNAENLASDELYTKVVSRRMLEMTRQINASWKPHVGETGVTCYTCHRGQPVPANLWFLDPGPEQAKGMAGNRAGQNAPSPAVGLTSLPFDPFDTFLRDTGNSIRVVSNTALPDTNRASIKQTEWTYGLMMHMSDSLGVNCTFCHNSRSFTSWDQSSPRRTTAYHGIQLVREVNKDFLEPLRTTFPPERLGPTADAPKVNCATCHAGAFKPLLGAPMLRDYPELAGRR